MASFEQNQQDQVNMNNNIDQIKQWQAEWDKAAASIGEAELEAEEELLGVRLKNLTKAQQTKLVQLGQLLELEEKGIQELAKLKLTLSNRQFAVRKKEIQKEFQLYKAAAEELVKAESKRKVSTQGNTSTKSSSSTNDLKASSKKAPADVAIQKASRNVRSAEYAVGQVSQEITDAISAIQEIAQAATKAAQTKAKPQVEQKPGTPTDQDTNQQGAQPVTPKRTETHYGDGGLDSGDKVDLDTSELKTVVLNDFSSILNSGDLVKAIKQTIKTVESYKSYNKQRVAELSTSMKAANAEKLKGFDPKVAMERAKQAEREAAKAASEKAYKEAKAVGKTEKDAKAIADKAGKDAGDKARKASLRKTADDYKALSDQVKKEQDKAEKKAIKKAKKAGLSDEDAAAEGKAARKKVTQESVLDANAEASAKLTANFELLADASGSLAKVLDADVKKISAMQGIVDTRLQGSQANDRDILTGSYWNELVRDVKYIAGASPFIKQEKLVDNVKTLVDKGISFDIKQRAFLMTIQEKIANTFNVADGTLLRLIRIQQQDTTAGRLGMESALNSFLNSMYETSEYLESVAANVRSSLEEMQALMDGASAAEVEFQVQKWMGSLYSVGMSDSAVQGIAQAFGQIASGDISGLTGSGTGNLLIMAANEAGKSIADILQKGLDADDTNDLMQAMVNYLAEIAETSSDSKVVQQQLANVYGIKASDLKAATNLTSSIKDVSNQELTYSGMLGQLEDMMNTIRFRTSVGEGMTNMWDNIMYSMASTQASNPMLYLLPKMADLLRDVTGGRGINLPAIHVAGFGVELNTTVADLMSIASLAGTALGTLGPALIGLADLVDPNVGSSMLWRAGIDASGKKIPVIARGTPAVLQNVSGASISESGQIVGNSSGDDVKNATLQDAADSKKKQMVEAKDEESADDVATKADLAVVNIYNLLEEVAHGSQSLRVKVINNGIGGYSGGSNIANGQNQIIGEPSGTNTTNNIMNTDNGNWVLTF